MSILNRALCVILVPLLLSTCNPIQAQNTDSNANSADDDETVLHEGKWIRSIQSSLIEEKFDDLDRMADQYRRDKSRMPGGDWRLHVFYSVLDAPQLSDQDTRDHLAHVEHWTQQRPASVTARIALATSLSR
jgi:Domain of unknown function (DUF4034)